MGRNFLNGSTWPVKTAAVIGLILIANGYAYAQGPREAKGLRFSVPEDWPIEKRGGVVAPIPTEEYVTIKFKAVEEEFRAVKDELSEKFRELQSDLKSAQEEFSGEIEEVRARSESLAQSAGDSADVLSGLESLQSELGRLDRKITNKVLEMQSQFETINQRMNSFENAIEELQTQIYKLDEKVDYIEEKQEGSY